MTIVVVFAVTYIHKDAVCCIREIMSTSIPKPIFNSFFIPLVIAASRYRSLAVKFITDNSSNSHRRVFSFVYLEKFSEIDREHDHGAMQCEGLGYITVC